MAPLAMATTASECVPSRAWAVVWATIQFITGVADPMPVSNVASAGGHRLNAWAESTVSTISGTPVRKSSCETASTMGVARTAVTTMRPP